LFGIGEHGLEGVDIAMDVAEDGEEGVLGLSHVFL
jgi:hypothetical protein